MENFFTNVKAILYDRLKSPFWPTLILICIAHYWPAIFWCFDQKENTQDKIGKISTIFSTQLTLPTGSELINALGLIVTTIVVILVVPWLNTLAIICKERAEGVAKKARNKYNPDYLNAEQYSQAVAIQEEQIQRLTKENSQKKNDIRKIFNLLALSKEEKEIFDLCLNNNALDRESLTDDQEIIAHDLHNKGYWGINSQQYVLTDELYRQISEANLQILN